MKNDIRKMQEIAYHANGSVRGMLAVTEEDVEWLSQRYDYYRAQVGDMTKQFIIPQGCIAAMYLHQAHVDAEIVYRALHHVSKGASVE